MEVGSDTAMKLFGFEIDFFPRRKVPPEEIVCFGCGRDDNSGKKIIAGPFGVFICEECVVGAELALTADDGSAMLGSSLERVEGRRCSFCNEQVAVAKADGEIGICRRCVSICQKIITEDRQLEANRPQA
jgi:ATP-dependent protease Clp ATPase subunit